MNKAAACIKLLEVLNTKTYMSRNELAELINTNPRNINEYIKEIQMLG
jgi:predicted DNA-binding transcriptional regulator YafY